MTPDDEHVDDLDEQLDDLAGVHDAEPAASEFGPRLYGLFDDLEDGPPSS